MTAFVFLGVYLVGLALSLLRHPIFGLYTYFLVYYLHPPERWWALHLPDIRWSLVAAAVTFVSLLRLPPDRERQPWFKTTPGKLLVLYVLWMWIQSLWAVNPEIHRDGCILFTKYLFLFYLIYRLTPDETFLRRFFWLHVIGCFWIGWLAYSEPVSGRFDGVAIPGLGDANAFGMHASTGIVFASVLLLTLGTPWRWILVPMIAFMLNGVILTASRSAFLGLLSMGAGLAAFKPPVYRKLFYGFGALGVLLFAMLAHDFFWNRMATIDAAIERREDEMDNSALRRWVTAEAQLQMAADHPFGAGHKATAELFALYVDSEIHGIRSSHNTFLAVLVDQGVPGLILFTAICLWAFNTLRKIKTLHKRGLSTTLVFYSAAIAASFVGFLIGGLFVNYIKSEVQIWLLALLATLHGIVAREIPDFAPSARRAVPQRFRAPSVALPAKKVHARRPPAPRAPARKPATAGE